MEHNEFDQLLRAAALGDGPAMAQIYESLAGKVQGYLTAQGHTDPEGGVNDVFLKVIPRLPDFEGTEANFRSWVFTIAHHLIIDDRRKRSRRPRILTFSHSGPEPVGGNVEAESMASLGDRWVLEVLASLPRNQRTVVLLRVIGDLTIDQVAEAMGKSSGAVKALQRRAFSSLQEEISSQSVTF